MNLDTIILSLDSLHASSLVIGALLVFAGSRFRLVMTFITNMILAWKGKDTKPLPRNGNGNGNYITREEFTTAMDRHIKSENGVSNRIDILTETVGRIDGKMDIIGKQVATMAETRK